MPKPKHQKAKKPTWFQAGDGVQGIGGGWHSRRRFRQPPQGKSGPVIRITPDMPEPEIEGGEVQPPASVEG